jgi:hypothetical protein
MSTVRKDRKLVNAAIDHMCDMDFLNSVNNDRATRVEKSPREFRKLKRMTAALHECEDLIRKICGAHIMGFVRWYVLVLGCCHLVQLLYSAEVTSRGSRKFARVMQPLRHAGSPRS